MQKVRPDNFVLIQGWMLTELGLSGNELMVYAIIYGFSQVDGQSFSGSLQYLVEWTNTSRMTVIRSLNSLIEKNLIRKTDIVVNGVKFCQYSANLVQGVSKWYGGSTKMIPNNIDDNTDKENLNTNVFSKKKASASFVPPTLEEVEAYVSEKGYNIDPATFFYYYDANGWYQGKKKLKSWKSAAAYWERNRKQSPEEIQKKKEEEDLKRYAQWEKEANDRKRLSETQEYNSEFL